MEHPKMNLNVRITAAVALAAALVASPAFADDDDENDERYYKPRTFVYEVTITNGTKGQFFSPPVLVTHSRDIAVFAVGEPALDELVMVAEDGNGHPLAQLLSELPQVFEAQATSEPIAPGGSAVYRIESALRFPVLSVVSMMVNTNDAMIAIDSENLPRRVHGTHTYPALGYDAGSEANNEDCDFIPGPACPHGNARSTQDAEGYVHIHNGVHGIADLAPDAYDWRNPVAQITVERIR
jgi:hypothetical protein